MSSVRAAFVYDAKAAFLFCREPASGRVFYVRMNWQSMQAVARKQAFL
ncbi:hypothetical protein [Marinococcus halotolerans]|nr:hypothetical protein [Marinococcus halotolerans]